MTTAGGIPVASRSAELLRHASRIELLLDLVFVFVVRQVTEVVAAEPSIIGVTRAAAILAVVWWMYDAFVWLGNQMTADRLASRVGFIAAMIAFLLIADAIPGAFGDSGLLFGFGLLAVVVIHFSMFVVFGGEGSTGSILRVLPTNVGGAVLVIAAGFFTGPVDWILFGGAILVFISTSLTDGPRRFDLGGAHFVDRHGLLMIIAFGETIIAVGAASDHRAFDFSLIVGTVLSVGIVAGMWWCYFPGGDSHADDPFASLLRRRRASLALTAFGLDHFLMILGVVLFSAGVRLLIDDVFVAADPVAAWLLAFGVGLFLSANARYRQELGFGAARERYVGAIAALPLGGLGLVAPIALEMVALLSLLALVVLADRQRRPESR